MDGVVIHTISISIVVIVAGRAHFVVEHPCRLIISLDGRLHEQCTAEHVGHVAIKALHILRSVGDSHVVLVGVRVDKAGAELDELGLHGIVHTHGEALEVRTGTFQSSFLVEVVETHIISIMCATTTEVHIVVLADTCLEHFIEPVSIGTVLEVIHAIVSRGVSTWEGCAGIFTGLTQIMAVLVGIHHIVDTVGNLVDTEVAFVIYLQRLVFLSALGSDDNHTVGGTRTVDSASRSIFQHLDGSNVVGREVTDGGSHGHTVDDIERSRAAERTDTADSHGGVGTRLSVGSDLHTCHLTFEHGGDVGVGYTFQFISIDH